MPKKKVLLTGASGSMGGEAFKELLRRAGQYDIVLLLRPSAANKKMFRRFEPAGNPLPTGEKGVAEADGLKIVWGDLTDPDDVLKAVNGVDAVLHPAAFISPEADHNPALAEKINVGGTRNLIRAVQAQPDGGDHVRFVYVGSVAQYGDRLPPIHIARAGDPLNPSVYDFYATTKIVAERAVIESGLKHWASIRQTYIAIPDLLSLMGPIQFHQPVNTHIELVTAEDAGYGLVQCLECPDDFFGRIYNMGGGPACRVVYRDYMKKMFQLLGLGDFKRVMDRKWFALRNFHCAWWEDSHVLNGYIGHWRSSLQDHYQQVADTIPFYVKLGRIVPKPIIKEIMKGTAMKRDGTLHWIENNNEGRISAFFGSRDHWKTIPGWTREPRETALEGIRLDHGYEERPDDDYSVGEMREAAKFRGGACLSDAFVDMRSKLRWKCAFGHEFEATPTLVLKAGHWCPVCTPPPWNRARIARNNPFYAQVYDKPFLQREEDRFYDEKCYEDILSAR